MKVVYVTSRFPFGPGEAFLAAEIGSLRTHGVELRVFPMLRKGGLVHADARRVMEVAETVTLGSSARSLARGLMRAPRLPLRGVAAVAGSNSRAARMRNGAVIARAAMLVDVLRRVKPDHLHVHWGGASSTLAMLAAEETGVPWSVTLHRWDIAADNLLARKLKSACFARVISNSGADLVKAIVPDARVEVIHMGVDVPRQPVLAAAGGPLRLACIAGLVEVKQHAALLDAFSSVARAGGVTLDLVGDGPLREQIAAQIDGLGLTNKVTLLGAINHADLLDRLHAGEWGGVVLTSAAGAVEQEGIPVSLMEAMAAGVPVLATDSGGTRELVFGGAGLLVPAGDSQALVEGLGRFVTDAELRSTIGLAGRIRVAESFDVNSIAARLIDRFAECGGPSRASH